MIYKDTLVIILSYIPDFYLDILLEELKKSSIRKLFVVELNEELNEWAKKNQLTIDQLKTKAYHDYSTYVNDIKLSLSEIFFKGQNCLFIYENSVTKDYYLKGAIYHLLKLLKNKNESREHMPRLVIELYHFFKNAQFSCVSNNKGKMMFYSAWELDFNIIVKKRLKKNRMYSSFFSTLIPPGPIEISDFEVKITDTTFYPYITKLHNFKAVLVTFFLRIMTSISIFFEIISFKWRRYKSLHLNK